MKTIPKRLFKIAKKARALTEKFAKKHPDIGYPEDLSCYCAIGSRILHLLAEKNGYELEFIQGYFGDVFDSDRKLTSSSINHCWLEYKGHVVDITATQFGIQAPVHVVSRRNTDQYHPVLNHTKFDANWDDQSPTRYTRKIKKLVANC